MDVINLGYFQEEHSSSCSYCEKSLSYSLGFVSKLLQADTYQQLMDRGWRRCGTYYYKYNFQQNCCLSYTIRAEANQNQQKKGQRKIAKTFLNVVSQELWNKPTQGSLKQYIQQSLELIQKQKNLKQNSKHNEKQQQLKNVQLQQNDKKQDYQNQQQISNEQMQELRDVLQQLLNYIEQNKQQFINTLTQYFNKKGFEMSIIIDMFKFNIDLKNVKILKSNQISKGDYYTNFLMLIYGINKKILFQDLSIQEFSIMIREFVVNYLKHDKYIFNLENTGYLSIFNEQNQKNFLNRTQVVIKQAIKLQQIKIEEENSEQKKNNIRLINQESFDSKLFKIGNMKVVLKPAECTTENFLLYQQYCKVIHNKNKESQNSYSDFLCQKALQSNWQQNGKQLLLMGCYHMNYYLGDRLVAVGVVDITSQALSSVYYFYDPDFEELNFGTFGALVEIEYIQLMNKHFPNFKYYYLGFYLQNTNKMSYKGDFEPCQLLCPLTYNWALLDTVLRKEIDKRQQQKPTDRVLQITQKEIKIIDDMAKKPDENFFQNFEVRYDKKIYKASTFNLNKLKPYILNAYNRFGSELMKKITFEL